MRAVLVLIGLVIAVTVKADDIPAPLTEVAVGPPRIRSLPRMPGLQSRQAIGVLRGLTGQGSGTVMAPRRSDGRWDVLTAHHVTGGKKATLVLKDGRTLALVPMACDIPGDLCWMVTVRADLADLPAAPLAKESPKIGEVVWQCGYGEHCRALVRHGTIGSAKIVSPERVHIRSMVINGGDSGAALLNSVGEVVGVVVSAVWPNPTVPGDGMAGTLDRARRLRPRSLPLLPWRR